MSKGGSKKPSVINNYGNAIIICLRLNFIKVTLIFKVSATGIHFAQPLEF